MSRKPRLKKARRIGKGDLFLTSGIRPIDSKCKINTRPGMHGAKRIRLSDYGKNLQEKQHFCISYGLRDHQLYRKHTEAIRLMRNLRRQGKEAEYKLLIMLETRLDRVVHRTGWAVTLAEARQLVSYKAILVNGKMVNKPGFEVEPGMVIAVKEKSQAQQRIHRALTEAKKKPEFEWINRDQSDMSAVFVRLPNREELPPTFQESQVIQFYSK